MQCERPGKAGKKFLSTPSARRATFSLPRSTATAKLFLSTPSARRATVPLLPRFSRFHDFYPRPPRGGRQRPSYAASLCRYNFYPRPPRGGRPDTLKRAQWGQMISIHALREEGDSASWKRGSRTQHFYPRPPRGGRRRRLPSRTDADYFYPRPPRGGRRQYGFLYDGIIWISIHALREEGDLEGVVVGANLVISIHALREEGDAPALPPKSGTGLFLSTPSARRATFLRCFR